jgi:hypothetical protein
MWDKEEGHIRVREHIRAWSLLISDSKRARHCESVWTLKYSKGSEGREMEREEIYSSARRTEEE